MLGYFFAVCHFFFFQRVQLLSGESAHGMLGRKRRDLLTKLKELYSEGVLGRHGDPPAEEEGEEEEEEGGVVDGEAVEALQQPPQLHLSEGELLEKFKEGYEEQLSQLSAQEVGGAFERERERERERLVVSNLDLRMVCLMQWR